MPIAAVAAAAGLNSISSIYGARQQASAARNAAAQQQGQYNQTVANLAPYQQLGRNAINPLWQAMGFTQDENGNYVRDTSNPLQQQFSFTPDDLTQYPGYQFALQQGLQGANASAAARGLGVSGADIRGTEQFAQGLASQTYGQAYDQALNKFQTNYNAAANNANRLYQLVGTGQNAAAQQGGFGANAAMNAGNFATTGAAAGAAGLMGASNALSNGVGGYLNYNAQNNLANAINNASGTNGAGANSGGNGMQGFTPMPDSSWSFQPNLGM